MNIPMLLIIGFASGIVTGIGVGGGAILIPALCLFAGMDQRTAQGINLLYFIPTASVAVITHIKNKTIDKRMVKGMILYGLAGAAAGSFLALAMEQELLRRLFGWFLLIMGAHELFTKKSQRSD